MNETTNPGRLPAARRLDDLARAEPALDAVRRRDLSPGDRVLIATRNSIYRLTLLSDGRFEVAGGRYRREGDQAVRVGVAGCSAGGSALFTRIVAAPGLFLELDDGTRTTRIRRVRFVRGATPTRSGAPAPS